MFHFISGMPRSGSTLLASILNQNPECAASIMTPVGSIVTNALQAMGPQNEADSYITDEQRVAMIGGIFEGFYWDEGADFIFDNNRRWTANAGVLAECFPDSKIVCCVRKPAAVIDSFERLFQKNPLNLSVIYGAQANLTVYERVNELMKPTGVVGFAFNALRSAYFGPYKDRLLLVPYDDLCRFPDAVMQDLTRALHLPSHNYRFDAIEQIPGVEQLDKDVSTPGLHTLKPKVVYEHRQSVLPPEIWNALPPSFWEVKEEATIVG